MNKFYKKFIFIFLFLIILNLTLSVVSAVDVDDVGTILNNDSDDIEYIDVGLNDNSIDVDGNVLDDGSEDVNNESFNHNSNISKDFNSDEAIFDKSVENYNLDNYDSKDIVITNLKEDSSKINSILEGVNNCIWLWPSNVNSINLTLLADSGINNIILGYDAFNRDNINITKFIEDCDNLGIKVHTWMQCFYNDTWKYPKYNDTEFNQTFVDEIIDQALFYVKNYDVAGVHLDYIRYAGSAYKHEGSIEAVTEVVRQITVAVKNYNPNLIVSATVMPEIFKYNENFTYNEYYYGQNITAMSQYLDVIIPMVYKGNFKKSSSWIKFVTGLFVNASVKSQIWTGLQAYQSDDDLTPLPLDELKFDSKYALEGGANGLSFFRDVLISYFNFTELYVSNVSASASDINFGDKAIIDIVVNPSVVIGNAIVYVDGKEVDTVELNKGQAKSIISNLNAGKHNFTVVYSGNYLPSSYSGYFMVNRKMINITATVDNITYGDNFSGSVNADVPGWIDVYPGEGHISYIFDKTGPFTTEWNETCVLVPGTYTAQVTFISDDWNYQGAVNVTYTISKVTPDVFVDIGSDESFDIKFGDTVVAIATVPSDATGVVYFSLDNETWIPVTIQKGKDSVEFDIPDLDAGNYILFVKYGGDNKYTPVYSENPFSVDQLKTIVTVDPVKGKAGEKVKITVRVTDENGNPVPEGTVIIGFNGKEYKANVVNGIAIVEVVLPNKAGTYSATAYYEGFNYNSSYTTFTVEVSDIPGPNPNPIKGNMENTGNPLLVLLIALAALGLESFRRKF